MVDVGVQVLNPNPLFAQVVGEVLGPSSSSGSLTRTPSPSPRSGRYARAVRRSARGRPFPPRGRPPDGPDHLFDHVGAVLRLQVPGWPNSRIGLAVRSRKLPRTGAGGNCRGGEGRKPMVDKVSFRDRSPRVLSPGLGTGHIALVQDHPGSPWEEVEQVKDASPGPGRRGAAVVLHPAAHPGLGQHLQVVLRPHPQPLRLEELAGPVNSARSRRSASMLSTAFASARPRCRSRCSNTTSSSSSSPISPVNASNGRMRSTISPKLDANGLAVVHGINLDGVAAGPELAAGQDHVVREYWSSTSRRSRTAAPAPRPARATIRSRYSSGGPSP